MGDGSAGFVLPSPYGNQFLGAEQGTGYDGAPKPAPISRSTTRSPMPSPSAMLTAAHRWDLRIPTATTCGPHGPPTTAPAARLWKTTTATAGQPFPATWASPHFMEDLSGSGAGSQGLLGFGHEDCRCKRGDCNGSRFGVVGGLASRRVAGVLLDRVQMQCRPCRRLSVKVTDALVALKTTTMCL